MARRAIAALVCAVFVLPLALWLALRSRGADARRSEAELASERLRAFDASRRLTANFAKLPTWDQASGPDPYAVIRVPGSPYLVGLLRGADSLVVLDPSAEERTRLPVPPSPVALAAGEDGRVFVGAELSTRLASFSFRENVLTPDGQWELDDIRAIRSIAVGRFGWVYLVEEEKGRLIALRLQHQGGQSRVIDKRELAVCRGPIRVERVDDHLVIGCVLEHALVIVGLDRSGEPSRHAPIRIVHDGPIWSFAAMSTSKGLLVAAGGVEDHPLDRTIGAFGYIDSFFFLYRVDFTRGEAVREASVNVSELGIVTPKTIVLKSTPSVVATVTGYGSDRLLTLSFPDNLSERPDVDTADFLPGASAVAIGTGGVAVYADPLLDAWITVSQGAAPRVVPVSGGYAGAAPLTRLGEALFFTTLIAPHNRSDGPLSRFTCETCHFEGYVDGRIHHTGREDVHAVTKPLLGLFNNRPHFSRALDPDLTAVAINEFRVAGAKSDHDPWFPVSRREVPWLRWVGWVGPDDAPISPEMLRKALMSFLMAFNHRPNPRVVGRTTFSDGERVGAELFRDHCESCHQSRLSADDPRSRVPFGEWEERVMAREGAIVWGKDEYAKTGILPYVHPEGARVPSLRRLYKKWPYFTNGSARDLESVLARARFLPGEFWHGPPAAGGSELIERNALDETSRAALIDFLRLL